ncbi:MAG: hypothetical protein ABID84_04095 [Chloroflexota bacterium]
MTFDAVLSDVAESFLASLSPVEREGFYRVLDTLCADPYPDNVSKVYLPFPYRPGTIGFSQGEFWVAYVILNAATIAVAQVYWSPDSPRHPLSRGRRA